MSLFTRIVAACVVLAPVSAWAQTASTPQAPLTVERLRTPLVIAPDYKITDLDGNTGQLAGAYAGGVVDEVLFIGGAAYWLANGSGGEGLTYGGLLLGWSSPERAGIRFNARGLVGFGSATLGRDVVVGRPIRFGSRSGVGTTTVRALAADDFMVFEPQAGATINVLPHTSINVGAGYRITGFTDSLAGRLNGVSGSVGLQLQW